MSENTTANKPKNFIYEIIDEDLKTNKWGGKVCTRFPPEPNGYLHIGHAKSICLNYGIARDYNGKFNLRFDDTNPEKEETEYVESIIEDVNWLGTDFGDKVLFASDYFEQMYLWAVELIKKGKAYVCDLNADEIRASRGTLTEPGKESPYRNRSIEENLNLFERMKNGEFANGTKTLRAKIDMASPNFNLRDPIMYRIIHAEHHRTGNKWCIYPTYDWAHGNEDSIEGITHSICTLEFENHRPLYDWFLDQLGVHHPQQIEFARLNLNYTVMSKRKLLQLVQEKYVDDWDDPRMPTISAYKRRGYTPEAIRNFAEIVGVAKRDALTDISLLEFAIRDDLNKHTQRVMAVLNPLKAIITNYPDGKIEELEAVNNPEDPSMGSRRVPFSKEIYIEQSDFMENPPKGFHRLIHGGEVRLRYAYIIKCDEVIKNDNDEIVELRCSYDPETKSGTGTSKKKVKGTIHWVSVNHAIDVEVRLYDRLFTVENPGVEENWLSCINPNSLEVISNAKLEPFLRNAKKGERFQFERNGYFCVETKHATNDKLVFNRTVTLRDSWAKK
ncbi:MAG: glutamine--tRNA ligase [Ignavibacteria bacterium RIFOXYB2_FULL_35_12]|nr:MAG: glutamine--tRNA ligase [Ignavibacteria bacterium GWA2_36_19]OGU55387.1 MAG: glutamine--tRNA ligase [Ignavibacteria bacterium GWC2_35_8]OGU59105.1 MAG: glutamine--tRNA ligase [Ignavibacteria bacterium GWF2_35_20]OGU88629.1 MAG: glutamine--tRNA ligase [Ignavibacteria bacterium RIFOXYA12_FULL_35_25]OGU89934.1 MAG: glutamine--tRNA ligase [Ignavibacteria bacterium RIFOXYC12_FULL_35_11]OGU96476.1 MAG: glutamine--tRNA ligase [Ignavibacteria bacterium RIFOXYB12_FULL_35_14]OGV00436.1 MAG: glut